MKNLFNQGINKIKSLEIINYLTRKAEHLSNWVLENPTKLGLATAFMTTLIFFTTWKASAIEQENQTNLPKTPVVIENTEHENDEPTVSTPPQIKSIDDFIKEENAQLGEKRVLPTNSEEDIKWAHEFIARYPIGLNAYKKFKETFFATIGKDASGNTTWDYGLRYLTIYPTKDVSLFMIINPELVGQETFEQQKLYVSTLNDKDALFMFYNYMQKEVIIPLIKQLRTQKISQITDQEIFSYIFKRYQLPTDSDNAIKQRTTITKHAEINKTVAAKIHYICKATGAGSRRGRLWEYLIAIGKIKPTWFTKYNPDDFSTLISKYIENKQKTNPKASFDSLFVQKDKKSFTTNINVLDDFISFCDKQQTSYQIKADLTKELDNILQVLGGEYKFEPTQQQITFCQNMIKTEEAFVLDKQQSGESTKVINYNHVLIKENLIKGYRTYKDYQQYKLLLLQAYDGYIKALKAIPGTEEKIQTVKQSKINIINSFDNQKSY